MVDKPPKKKPRLPTLPKLPRLPTEILGLILWHVRPHDLRKCLFVNSTFYALAQPLFNRYAATDGSGFFFPLSSDESLRVASFSPQSAPLDLLKLNVHPHTHCYPSDHEKMTLPSIASCRVLSIGLRVPDNEDHMASAHTAHFRDDPEHFDPTEEFSLRPLHCHMLHVVLDNAFVDKLVLHNVPAVYGNVDPDLIAESAFRTIREAVLLLNLDSLGYTNEHVMDRWHATHKPWERICEISPESLEYPRGSIATALPPNVEELTFVFTPTDHELDEPEGDAIPYCCHADPDQFKSLSKLDADLAVLRDDDAQASCWQEPFWRELAAAIAPLFFSRLCRVTVVNASIIVPKGQARTPTIAAIKDGTASHSKHEMALHRILREHLSANYELSSEQIGELIGRVRFMYKGEWMFSTDWEDVWRWEAVKSSMN